MAQYHLWWLFFHSDLSCAAQNYKIWWATLWNYWKELGKLGILGFRPGRFYQFPTVHIYLVITDSRFCTLLVTIEDIKSRQSLHKKGPFTPVLCCTPQFEVVWPAPKPTNVWIISQEEVEEGRRKDKALVSVRPWKTTGLKVDCSNLMVLLHICKRKTFPEHPAYLILGKRSL